MIDCNITLRKMQMDDIPAGLSLSMAEKWNQTEQDWEIFLKGRENIQLVAECNGKVVATTTAINYANHVAWIGMVLVNRDYRGMGISKMLLKEALDNLGNCSSIKLDATPAGQPVYKKIGFEDEYIIHRMTRLPETDKNFVPEGEHEPLPLSKNDIEEMVKMDRKVFGADRGILVRDLAKTTPERAWMLRTKGAISGFSLGRPGSRYTQIGPVSATNDRAVKSLLSAAFKGLDESPVVVDVMADKTELIDWLESRGFVKQRIFTRMYLNENPFPGTVNNQYLICGPEFG